MPPRWCLCLWQDRHLVWGAIQSKIVYGENVRQELQFAESGNADAAITSLTLLTGRGAQAPEIPGQRGGAKDSRKRRFVPALTHG